MPRITQFFIAESQFAGIVTFPFPVMKENTHPNYLETTITCACGTVYTTRSTRRDIKIGICASCHPFFTGEHKFVDTAGRIEKFARRYGTARPTKKD